MKTMSSTFFKKAEAQASTKKSNFIPAKTKGGSAIVSPATIPAIKNTIQKDTITPENTIPSINRPILTIDHIPASFPHPALVKLFFSEKPKKEIREAMKYRNFWYHPNDNGWSHIDTPECRKWLNEYFNAELEIDDAPEYNDKLSEKPLASKTAVNVLETPEDLSTSSIIDKTEHDDSEAASTPGFEIYKKQVNELVAFLKCDPSDLALIAVDCLYRQTFN